MKIINYINTTILKRLIRPLLVLAVIHCFTICPAQIEVLPDNSVGVGTSNTHDSKFEVYGNSNNLRINFLQEHSNDHIGLNIRQMINTSLNKTGIKIDTRGSGANAYFGIHSFTLQEAGSNKKTNGIYNRVILHGSTPVNSSNVDIHYYASGFYNYVSAYSPATGKKVGINNRMYNHGTGNTYGILTFAKQVNPSSGTVFAIYSSSGGSGWAGYFVGNVNVTGTVTSGSDKKLKTDIQDLDKDKVKTKFKKLKAKQYKLKADKEKRTKYGFIAQDIQAIFPEMVYESETADMPIYSDESGNSEEEPEIIGVEKGEKILGISYTEFIPMMIQIIQDQEKVIVDQQAKLNDLEKRIEKLEKK